MMKDTSPQMNMKMIELIQKKTPQERIAMGCSMFDFSKQLLMRSLLNENPALSSRELKRKLFLRFYGQDFGPDEQGKILAHFC